MIREPVVCPCCPLHCDDVDPTELMNGKTGCDVADSRIASMMLGGSANDPANLATCRQWLRDANRVIVTGHVIDLETSRAVSEFAAATGADLHVASSNPAMLAEFAREGAFLTTLGELVSRDVSLLVIGDVASSWPRIETRIEKIRTIQRWRDDDELPAKLATLRGAVSNRFLPQTRISEEVAAVTEIIKASTYFVVLVAPLSEDSATSPIIWSTILGMIRELNSVTRAAILSFDQSVTVRSVMASRFDPKPYRLPLDENAIQIHFSPFGETHKRRGGKSIVIGIGDKVFINNQLCLPASVPGLHHSGIVFRGDGSVTLPLQNCLERTDSLNSLPTPAEQLRRLFASD